MIALRIPIDRARKARYIIAAILLLAGAAKLWTAQSGELDKHLFGWFFLAGGALFLAYRNYIEIDPAKRRLSHRTGFLYGFARSDHDTESITRITLTTFSVKRSRGGSSLNYQLLVNGYKSMKLCNFDRQWMARLAAERVCRALRVEFDNQRFDVSSVRASHELDLPLAERWRSKGEVKTAPVLDASSTLELASDGDGATLSCPNTPAPILKIILAMIPIVALLVWIGSTSPMAAIGVIVFGGIGLSFAIVFILSSTGPIVLRVTPTAIECRHGMMPPYGTLPIAEIEELIDEEEGLHLMTDRDFLTIHHPADPRDRQLQRQFLEYQIAMRQPALIAGLRKAF